MITDMTDYVRGMVESFFDVFPRLFVNQEALLDWARYTSTQKEWTTLDGKEQLKLIGLELSRLQKKKLIRQATPDEIIRKEKFYIRVEKK